MTEETQSAFLRAADAMESKACTLDSQNIRLSAMCGKVVDTLLSKRLSGIADGLREGARLLRDYVEKGSVPGDEDER